MVSKQEQQQYLSNERTLSQRKMKESESKNDAKGKWTRRGGRWKCQIWSVDIVQMVGAQCCRISWSGW